MIKSLNAALSAGASPETALFHYLLAGMELQPPVDYAQDDTRSWPAAALAWVQTQGLVQEGPRSASVFIDECCEPDSVEIAEWQPDPQTGRLTATVRCPNCQGLHLVDYERTRTWLTSTRGLAQMVATVLGLGSSVQEDVPDRLFYLGHLTNDSVYREIFLARGLRERDAASVIACATRLLASPAPVVLVPTDTPRPSLWPGLPPAIVVMEEITTIAAGRLQIDLAPLLAQRPPTPVATPPIQGNQPNVATLALPNVDLTVLQALGESPHEAMFLQDIIAASGYNKHAVRDAIERLITQKLAVRPNETQRKGLAITTQGRQFLRQLPGATQPHAA